MWLDATRAYARIVFAVMAMRGEEVEKCHSMRHFLGPLGFLGAGGSSAATIACQEHAHVSGKVSKWFLK